MILNIVLYIVLSWTVAHGEVHMNASAIEELRVKLGTQVVKLTCPLLKKSEENQNAEQRRGKHALSYNGNAMLADRVLDLKPFDSIVWVVDKENILVAAGMMYDNRKYDYHPSTGQLVLQKVEATDVGYYHCLVTFGQGDPNTSFSRTELGSVLLSLSDGNAASGWYAENETNIVRGAIAAGVAGCVISAVCIVCKYGWRKPRKSQLVITNSQEAATRAATAAAAVRMKKNDCCEIKQNNKSTNTINTVIEEDRHVVTVCAIDFDDDEYDDDHDEGRGACRREFNFKSNQHKLKKPFEQTQQLATCHHTCHLHEKPNCIVEKTKTHLGNSIPAKHESHQDKSSYPLSVTSTRTHSSQSSPNPSISSKL